MARRNRASGPAISLFSFQDIITSVTAILILMVLILTLELISRLQRGGASAADVRTAADLRSALADLDESIRMRERDLADRTKRAEAIATMTPDDLRKSIEATDAEASRLQDAIATIDRDVESAASERRVVTSQLVETEKLQPELDALIREAGELRTEAARLAKSNASEAEKLAHLEQRNSGRSLPPSTLVFNKVSPGGPQPRLVDVSGGGVRILGVGAGSNTTFNWPASGVSPAFLGWLGELDQQREYVVLILRPSGLPHYIDVRTAIAEKHLSMGFEVISEAMTVIVKE